MAGARKQSCPGNLTTEKHFLPAKKHLYLTQENVTIILLHAFYIVLDAGREMVGLTQESLHVLMANHTGVIHSKVAMDKSGSGAGKTHA